MVRTSRWRVTRRGTGAGLIAAVVVVAALPAAAGAQPTSWLTAWSASQENPGPLSSLVALYAGTGGRTVRDVVRPTADGRALRVRLTNRYGSRPLTFDDVRVGVSGGAGTVRAGSAKRVTFGGRDRVTIPVGHDAVSDLVPRTVRFGQRLAVSAYSAGATGTTTTSGALLHTNYISVPGDHAADSPGSAFTTVVNHWYFLAGIDVVPRAASRGAVVAFGASITAGVGATVDADRGWADLLADRVHARFPRAAMPVLNAGIPGNTLHESSPCYGASGIARMTRDVLAQSGIGSIVLDLGGNDITQPNEPHTGLFAPCDARTPISTDGLIALYRKVIAGAHARGVRIFGTTITPFGGMASFTPAMDAERVAVNRWIRTSGAFDGVIDFAAAIADPADPARIAAQYDSGDGLHPNDAGHAALAGAIPLTLFTRGGR